MKGKRLTATIMALALTASLLTAPAAAASFSDLKGHWAQSDVEYLAGQGIIQGYNDGTFKPDAVMSAVEALLFCARVTGLEEGDKEAVSAHWADTLSELLPESMQSWASEELAICLETGILSQEELETMVEEDLLLKSMERQEVARCLVRAIQMDPMTRKLGEVTLTYDDEDQIDSDLRAYVYVLDTYGIVKGNDKNQFLPTGGVTRAEMSTLLRRSLDFMEERGVVVELPAYTDYDWAGGVITAVEAGKEGAVVLTLEDELLGEETVTIPTSALIYDNNMESSASALRTGVYVRVNFDESGKASTVRVGGALTTISGTVTDFDGVYLTVKDGENTVTLKLDRFTAVEVGNRIGTVALLDPEGGYTTAVCRVDALGHPAAVQLTGGSRQETGLLTGLTTDVYGMVTGVTVTGFDGVRTPYTLASGAEVTVNGLSGALKESYTGAYVTLRVSNDQSGKVMAVGVDTDTDYIQGSVQGMSYSSQPNTVTVLNFATDKSSAYELSEEVKVTYEGRQVQLKELGKGDFVTLRLTDLGKVDLIDAWPGSSTVTGTITAITYGVTTTIQVTLEDGSVRSFDIDLSDPPDIYRDDRVSSIDKLRTGDEVEVTVRYNQITELEATAQSANATGTITAITMDTAGTTVSVSLTGGGSKNYLITDGVTVTQDGKAASVSVLKPGDQIAMVVEGDQVLSIEVQRAASSSTQITGAVLYVNTSEKTIFLQRTDESGITTLLTVDASDAELLTSTGKTLSLKELTAGDAVQVYGAYDGATFEATILIRT